MAQSLAIPAQNSLLTSRAFSLTSEIQQYDKVLKLRDEIIAGTHPRIKLPSSKPIQVVAPTSSISPATGLNNIAKSNVTVPTAAPIFAQTNGLPGLSAPIPSFHDSGSNPRSKLRLERQRIERDLAESNRKEKDAHKPYEQDVLPDFDVSEAFFQAQELVKHQKQASGHNVHASRSRSDDEDTFYSSPVASPGSDEYNSKTITSRPCKFFFEDGSCKKGDKCNFSHDPAFRHQLQRTATGTANKAPRPGYTAQGGRIRESPVYNIEDGEVVDDAPYSPSMNIAIEDLSQPQESNQVAHQPNIQNHLSRDNSRTENRQQRGYSPRGKETPIIRNHITSPVAPQPSRVSPLAVAKVPRIEHGRNDHNRVQPNAATPQSGPRSRKRRRDMDADDNTRNVAPRTTMGSPEPYIKPEPLSPPPLSTITQPARRQSGYVNNSPRYNDRAGYEADAGYERPSQRTPTMQTVSHRRIISGPGPSSEPRRQQDLRRIVSTRNLERPSSAGYSTGARPRTSSRMIMPRQEVQPISYRASVQPQRPDYIVAERPLSPAIRYAGRVGEPELIPMAPPSGRIVVDEYGNRYLETVVEDRRASMVPETRYISEIQRRPEVIESIRASVRPEPRYVEDIRRASVRPEPRYVDDVRRHPEVVESIRASLRPETRYYDDQQYPTEPISRVRASVRPEAHYYDERSRPADAPSASRTSIRPEARAEAVFINPRFEQFNFSGPPSKPERGSYREGGHQQAANSPPPTRSHLVEYRESARPASRSAYDSDRMYSGRQDMGPPLDAERLIRRAENYSRMADDMTRASVRPAEPIGRASVRPSEYVERGQQQTSNAEVYRYREPIREPLVYSNTRQDAYGRQEVMEVPSPSRAAYRYVPTGREIPQGARMYDEDLYID